MARELIIGDIHGCFYTLRNMVEEIICLTPSDKLYLLGDYIDRGPRSKSVIDFLLQLKSQGYQIFPIKGNHEQMLIDTLHNEQLLPKWIKQGGDFTLKSFNIWDPKDLDENYIDFFYNLPLFVETENFYTVHGAIDFNSINPLNNPDYMLWERKSFIDDQKIGDKCIFHGHTPITIESLQIGIENKRSRIYNLDSGCVYKAKWGYLSCFDFTNQKLYYTQNKD